MSAFISSAAAARLACLILLVSTTAHAQITNGPTEDSTWYYEIGGAEPVAAPLNPGVTSIGVGGSAELSAGFSCGQFNPVVAVAHSLNELSQGIDNMVGAMTAAATSAIASLPALILQRANPGLYDLFQNALLRAEYSVDVATKSCEQMERAIAAGKNPYRELVVLSKGNDWSRAMGVPSGDIVETKEQVESSNGSNGIPWVGGVNAGGSGQDPLRFTEDVVSAGYNLHLSRSVTDTSPAPTVNTTQIASLWPTPQHATDWVRDVVGEHAVTTCDGCLRSTSPGTGLKPKLVEEQELVEREMNTILTATTPPRRSDLSRIAAPGIAITREVIDAIRELPESEQTIVAHRLVAEIAVARTLDKAFYARRLLQTGRQIPELNAVDSVGRHVEDAVDGLDAEIERIVFEHRVRREIVSDTVSQVLQRANAKRQRSLLVPQKSETDPRPLDRGAIR